jgi:hypothetical protein
MCHVMIVWYRAAEDRHLIIASWKSDDRLTVMSCL